MHKMQGREKKKRDRKEEHTREEEGKQKMSCKEGQHLKLCSPKSEKKHSKRREVAGRRNFLLVIAPAGRQARQSLAVAEPAFKRIFVLGQQSGAAHTIEAEASPHTKFHTHKHTTKSACSCIYYISIYTIYI